MILNQKSIYAESDSIAISDRIGWSDLFLKNHDRGNPGVIGR